MGKSITQLLMEMKTENQVTALNHQNEFLGLKNLMVNQEISLAQKISESNENLKKMISDSSTYFQSEINKINAKFEESERRTENLIEAAIKAERERNEKKQESAKTNLAAMNLPPVASQNLVAPFPPPVPTIPRSVIPERLDNGLPGSSRSESFVDANGEKTKNTPVQESEDDKPAKFLDESQEKKREINVHKKKIIMKVERADFTKHIQNYDPEITDEYVFKNPVTYAAREAGVREKIYNATGIHPNKLDIIRVSTSTKRAKLAWISFKTAKTVSDIFRLAMQNGGSRDFNAFPHIPGKALKRHDAIVEILKRLQEQNLQLRYQIRLGQDDLEVRLKNHVPTDYRPYVRVEINTIDPNGEVPEWELSSNRVNPFTRLKKGNKRSAEESPENQKAQKKNKEIPEWRVGEFLWEFLEGTKTKPDYETEDVEVDELEEDDMTNVEETAETTNSAETDTDLIN